MFIAHLPAGYLLFKPFQKKLAKLAFALGLVGSVAPDLDLIRFYFVDHRAFHHHEYITHRPLLWAGIALAGLILWRVSRYSAAIVALGLGGALHMLLDTIAGAINWAWPFGASVDLWLLCPPRSPIGS